MTELMQLIANGVATGSLLALAALGASLLFGVLDIGNFAHGDFMTFGAYSALVLNIGLDLPLPVAFLGGMATTAVLAVIGEYTLFRPMRRRAAGVGAILILTLGLALVIRYSLYLAGGVASRTYRFDETATVELLGVRFSQASITVILCALVAVPAVALLLARSRAGKYMRAVSSNTSLASVSGVDTGRVAVYTWVLAGGLAGLAGGLLGLLQGSFNVEMGWSNLFLVFAAVILGGAGSAYGAMIAGFTLGIVMEVSTWSGFAGGLPIEFKPVLAFVLMITLLIVRPEGVLGKAKLT
jgi:branched-subunit amino acid ABC-type transport system permease component